MDPLSPDVYVRAVALAAVVAGLTQAVKPWLPGGSRWQGDAATNELAIVACLLYTSDAADE